MFWILFLLYFIPFQGHADFSPIKISYPFSSDPIDVVIPCAPKDRLTLELCIEGIKKNGANLRRIIVISAEKMTESAEWFNENEFPFSKGKIALEIYEGNYYKAEKFLRSDRTRVGWIFQQLLKLYAPFVIPNISPNVLILDADVVFLKPTCFMTEIGEPYFMLGTEYCRAYFEHGIRLLPGFHKVVSSESGICHHMLFQRPVLEDLFSWIEKEHRTEPWKAICRCIDHKEVYASCMSEYEIYFNFLQIRSNQAHKNRAKWREIHTIRLIPHYRLSEEVFVAIPEWLRKLRGQVE